MNKDLVHLSPYEELIKQPIKKQTNPRTKNNPQLWVPIRKNDELNKNFAKDSDLHSSKFM